MLVFIKGPPLRRRALSFLASRYRGAMAVPPVPSPGAGAFGILGGLILPISLILAWRKGPPGPVGALIRAGAIGPSVALKPKTAGITRPGDLDRFLRAGIVQALADGRVWVDLAEVRRRRRRWMVAAGALAIVTAIGIWWAVRAVGTA